MATHQQKQLDHRLPIYNFLDALRTRQLYAEEEPGAGKRSSFVPHTACKAYLEEENHNRLHEILEALFAPDSVPFDPETILSGYVSILCILVEIGKGEAIAVFVQRGKKDHGLPFEANHEPQWWPPDTDNSSSYQRFCQKQWRFCVEPFTRDMPILFDVGRILPIVKKEPIDVGGTATIHKIKLHSSYNKLHYGTAVDFTDESNTFVLKTYIGPEAETHYKNEVAAFRRMRPARNEHVISFYGNYVQGDSYNLILEYADQGSLQDYFKNFKAPHTKVDIVKFWTGLSGLFKALASIHNIHQGKSSTGEHQNFVGWHQDIKPQNILVISNKAASEYDYQFKLADLGVCHFAKTQGAGGVATALDSQGTQTYAAPECWRPTTSDDFWYHSELHVTQFIDIWSLGCVFSEAAVWMAEDYTGILAYNRARAIANQAGSISTSSITTYQRGDCFHDGTKVLDVVTAKHSSLETALRKCDNLTPGILTMVDKCMLLENPEHRLSPKQLSFMCQQLLETATDDTPRSITFDAPRARELSLRARRQTPPEQPPSEHAPPPRAFTTVDEFGGRQEFDARGRSGVLPDVRATRPYSSATLQSSPEALGGDQARTHNTDGNILWSGSQQHFPQNQTRALHENFRRRTQDSWENGGSEPKDRSTMRNTMGYSGQSHRKVGSGESGTLHEESLDERQHDRYSSPLGIHNSQSQEPDHHQQSRDHSPTRATRNNTSRNVATPPEHSMPPERPPLITPPPSSVKAKPTATNVARQKRTAKLPHLSITVANRWKDDKKHNKKPFNRPFNRYKQRELNLPGDWLLDTVVGKRDHIFVIDDSISMTEHWVNVVDLYSALAYIVKESDKDGIDTFFTMSDTRYNDKHTSQTVEIIRKRKLQGDSNINIRLGQILGEYDQKLRNQIALRKSRSTHAPKNDLKPLSIYVFTNGIWTPKSDPKQAIANIVKSLEELNAPTSQIGIQFISFGHDAEGLKRLQHYDKGLGLARDIVDHTPWMENLWKMMVGAIDPDYDGDSDDSDTVAKSCND